MAYSAPRTWDGTETTQSAYLQTMRANNVALHGRLPKVNIGFYGAVIQGDNSYKIWVMQHRLRYLHYHFQVKQGDVTAAKVFVTTDLSSFGSNLVSHNGSYASDSILSSAGGDGGTAIDLNGLTVGSWYYVIVEVEGADKSLYVLNLYESSEA